MTGFRERRARRRNQGEVNMNARSEHPHPRHPALPGQVVLVFQGGGALGAYQVGVYQALHDAGIEPDWVIGTSIGAINAALIAGNPPGERMTKLDEFWYRLEHRALSETPRLFPDFMAWHANMTTLFSGIQAFFTPNPLAWFGVHSPVGVEGAAFYTTAPLRDTLTRMVDFDYINGKHTRLTVGAVSVRNGSMHYFDSRGEAIDVRHVLASGALPPAFPAVRIDGDPYWDGGIYSNTPIEAVLDDRPRRDSIIFTVHMWNPMGPEPRSLWEVFGRQKDIQYASRADSHIARQQQIHHLRHVIRELTKQIPEAKRDSAAVRELSSWGCGTTMHVVRLLAPRLDGEDHTKDIDFTPTGLRDRRQAGYAETRQVLAQSPWTAPVDPTQGVVIHDAKIEVTAEAMA
jgi:NTE family protein